MFSEKSEINRVVRRGEESDRLMSRASLSRLLGNTVLQLPGLPGDAVLIAKTIRCAVKQSPRTGSSGQITPSAWQAGVNHALEKCCQRVARYVNGRCVDSDAASVRFDTVPESLACFLCDIACGNVHGDWWWTTYLRKYPVGSDRFSAIATVIGDNLIFLPQIVSYLAGWKRVPTVFNGLSDTRCVDLIGTFQSCFGMDVTRNNERLNELVCLLASLDAAGDQWGQVELHPSPPTGGLADRIDGDSRTKMQATPPHPTAARYHQPTDIFGHQSLTSLSWVNQPDAIGLLDALYSATRYNSYRDFFNSFWQKFAAGSSAWTELSFAQGNLAGLAYVADQNVNVIRAREFQNVFCVLLHPAVQSQFNGMRYVIREKLVLPARIVKKRSEDVGQTPGSAFPAPQNRFATDSIELGQTNSKRAVTSDREGDFAKEEHSVLSKQCSLLTGSSSPQWQWTTDYGGVLYLFNLLRFLNIPDVFADHGNIRSTLSLWAWMEMLARYLLPDDYNLKDDLWQALALLDNRDANTMVGGEALLDGELYVPKMWLGHLESPDVGHPSGAESAEGVTAALGIILTNSSLLGLLEILLPIIKKCLLRATGGDGGRIADEVLRCRGHISISRTHLDFYTSIDNISLTARRAGLDRDPGWCPEVAKVVQFHFE